MRLGHFATLRPICPSCKITRKHSPLSLKDAKIEADVVVSGLLMCPASDCGKIYPILFGRPILVPDVESWLSANIHIILQRDIDDEKVESYLGETISSDLFFNISRQQQSSYCMDHYCEETARSDAEGVNLSQSSVLHCLDAALVHIPDNPLPIIDLGCAVGGTTFHLAQKRNRLTLGVDMNWPLLSIGSRILDDGVISFPKRIIGDRYQRISLYASFAGAELCDFWVADATCLPFQDNCFGLAIGFNLLDCVYSAESLLQEILRIVAVEGGASLASPLDWGSHATPKKNWICDISDLDKVITSSTYRTDVSMKEFVELVPALERTWRLPLHERSVIHYLTRAYVLEVAARSAEGGHRPTEA